MRAGWMVVGVGEDNGSQFSQGSTGWVESGSQASHGRVRVGLGQWSVPSTVPVPRRRNTARGSPSRRRGGRGVSGSSGRNGSTGLSRGMLFRRHETDTEGAQPGLPEMRGGGDGDGEE